MHMFGDYGMGFGGVGMIMMVLFWAVIIVVIIFLIKMLAGKDHGRDQPESGSALDILKKRYANGEIDAAEYERIRKELLK